MLLELSAVARAFLILCPCWLVYLDMSLRRGRLSSWWLRTAAHPFSWSSLVNWLESQASSLHELGQCLNQHWPKPCSFRIALLPLNSSWLDMGLCCGRGWSQHGSPRPHSTRSLCHPLRQPWPPAIPLVGSSLSFPRAGSLSRQVWSQAESHAVTWQLSMHACAGTANSPQPLGVEVP